MLNQCKDYDDCGCVVGRVALASIEGEVLMSVYSSCDAHAPLSRNVELCSDFSYKNRGDECPYTLTLTANVNQSAELFVIYELGDDIVREVQQCIENDNCPGLSNAIRNNDTEYFTVFNLRGDEEEDQVSYLMEDENGDEVEEEACIIVQQDNVFNYDQREPYINKKHHPKHVLIHKDYMKRGYGTYSVRKDFRIENCHFSNSKPFDPEVLDCEWMESVVTSVDGPIRCHGVVYECIDAGDAGSYGSTEYILYEYNEQLGRYEKVAEMA